MLVKGGFEKKGLGENKVVEMLRVSFLYIRPGIVDGWGSKSHVK